MTSLLGSSATTLSVDGNRAALSAKIPPPQPTSRYRRLAVEGGSGCESRQEEMKSWRRGSIWWRRREEPCGSHHDDASLSKWDISVGFTEEVEEL